MRAPVLDVRGLSLSVPVQGGAAPRLLVKALDLCVLPGERWCVLGRNAVGKSTLLRALAGLPVSAQSGEIEWSGRAVRRWSPEQAARLRAYQPQAASDRFGMSVRRLLELVVCAPGGQAEAVLAALDADALIDRDVRQLSGGERQRVALAQCALQGAPLLLLDEPVSFQDPAHQLQVARWLVAITQPQAGDARALVMSAHDVNWVARVATHVLLLLGDAWGSVEHGAWAAGPVGELLTAPHLQAAYGCTWRSVDGVWMPV